MVGLSEVASGALGGPARSWYVWAAGLAAVIAGFLLAPSVVNGAETGAGEPADCSSCHKPVKLEFHDTLGFQDKACFVCHDNAEMNRLRLADATIIPVSQSSQLCGQCHQQRYKAWQEGTHGIPGTVAEAKCTTCHNPHQPQVAFSNITRPHPGPVESAPPVPFDLVMMAGISLLAVIGLSAFAARRREGL